MKVMRILGKRGRVTIPYELRKRVGFGYNDILSFSESEDGRSVTVTREKICDNCKGAVEREQSAEGSFFDFLNSLSPEQQRAALVHLSVKWAQQEGDPHDGV